MELAAESIATKHVWPFYEWWHDAEYVLQHVLDVVHFPKLSTWTNRLGTIYLSSHRLTLPTKFLYKSTCVCMKLLSTCCHSNHITFLILKLMHKCELGTMGIFILRYRLLLLIFFVWFGCGNNTNTLPNPEVPTPIWVP